MTSVPSAPIGDYALIGNCRSAALVSKRGSLDWLCWPRFDSPAIFASLLDPEGGTWSITPVGALAENPKREYLPNTAVIRSTFCDESAELTLTDAMTLASPESARDTLSPENEIVRIVTCTRGSVEIEIVFDPRPNFGKREHRLIDRGKLGIRLDAPDGLLTLRSEVPLRIRPGRGAHARVRMHAGESLHFSLTHTVDAPAIIPPLGEWTRRVLAGTVKIWEDWAKKTTYHGPYRAHVVRSAIVVRLLAFAPSGAIVAAPTTSLPEVIGGKHNWDYRFCWLRDAAFSVRGMLALGHRDVAEAFTGWLLYATRLTQPKLMILYDVYGRRPPKESELGLAGYAGSRPARVGNGAAAQLQLDCYGEVVDAVWHVACARGQIDHETASTVEGFARYVCEHWREPDSGIWEPRTAPKQHTHSLALCWVALDRLLDLQQRGLLRSRHRVQFSRERDAIRAEIEKRGYDEELQSYTSELGGTELDATLLLLGWYGYAAPGSPRMQATYHAISGKLSPAPGLLYRYRNPGDLEGAFVICSFWIAEHLARGGGSYAEARAAFERTLAYANDVGLFAEEIDPVTGAALGNFPQNFSHVGLINAALSLVECAQRESRALEAAS